ncbi:hypothetical protein BDDG_13620 [Blastomyces dermatitidis ATCC 18188]|uniref:Uncharacterized protein n=1 Tax=Ajellomyces dermatitidis (strain ATCC 18188 / CBS 674.68) TaxID=653446 RepID=A0A0J9ETW8_AJEDA|nr:hypothetical protein BDDG_13620 [Blastomyces dermatitidis ATCC 18188]
MQGYPFVSHTFQYQTTCSSRLSKMMFSPAVNDSNLKYLGYLVISIVASLTRLIAQTIRFLAGPCSFISHFHCFFFFHFFYLCVLTHDQALPVPELPVVLSGEAFLSSPIALITQMDRAFQNVSQVDGILTAPLLAVPLVTTVCQYRGDSLRAVAVRICVPRPAAVGGCNLENLTQGLG